jgi:Carboxypeptidase regulatory-like domain
LTHFALNSRGFCSFCLWLLLGIFVLMSAAPSTGQTLTGELDGTVRDKLGAVVPNALVTITNSDENQVVRTVKTDNLGQFTAPLLTIGTYSIRIKSAGFQDFTLNNLNVNVGQPLTVSISVSVGTATETVNVQAGNINVQLDTASAGTLIDKQQVTQLSLSNRNYLQLLAIQPGISGGIPGEDPRGNILSSGAVNTQTFAVDGNATSTNGYYLDGADTLKRAGQAPVTFPGVDFIREINLLRGSYGADIGGPGAAVVTVQTKSGTTAFHGGAYGFFRSQIFNANTPLANETGLPRQPQRAADFGYYVGGPLWIPGVTKRATSKTFFFFGQEFGRELDSYVASISNIPTQAQRAGNFPTAVCTAYNAAATTCTASATSIESINTIAAEYLKDVIDYVPLPNNPGDPQGLIYQSPGTNNETQTMIRIDRQFSSKLSAFFRYLDDPFKLTVPYGFQTVSFIPGVATAAMTDGSTSWFGHITYVVGSNHVFEGGYSQRANWVTAIDVGRMANINAPDVQIQLPYANVLDHIPDITINGSNYKGSGRYNERSPEQQIFLNNTNSWGRHTVKIGANVELQVSYSNSAAANSGTFTFPSTPVPAGSGTTTYSQAFANFLQGRSSQFTQANVDIDSAAQSNIYEGYVEDDVHLTPRLTVLGGIRYTFFSPYSSAAYQGNPFHPQQNFFAPNFNPAQAPTLDQNGNLCFTAPCGTSGRVPNPNYNATNGIIVAGVNSPFKNAAGDYHTTNFAPRFGFTYDLFGNGRASLRGGFGIYYDQLIENTAKFPTNQDPPNVITATVANPSFSNPGNGSSPSPQGLQAYQETGHPPYTEQYSLDLQQQLRTNISIDIGYYGNLGRHEQASIDLNQPAPGAFRSATGAPSSITAGNTPFVNLVRAYQNWSFITDEITPFVSSYNSLQTSMRIQTHYGAQFLVNYTWSHALTNARTPQCNCDLAVEYGDTAYDRHDIFNAAIVYPFPFWLNQQHLYQYILGGWQTSAIVTYGSGQFFTVGQSGVDPAGIGLLVGPGGARPDQISDPNIGAPHRKYSATGGTWFNTNAYAAVPAGQYRPGDAPVANIRAPGYEVWNLSLFKNIKIRDNVSFQFRAETFNTFNHANPSTLNATYQGTPTGGGFGEVTAFGDPRRMQLGIKLTF